MSEDNFRWHGARFFGRQVQGDEDDMARQNQEVD
jgi:hypothetical protein